MQQYQRGEESLGSELDREQSFLTTEKDLVVDNANFGKQRKMLDGHPSQQVADDDDDVVVVGCEGACVWRRWWW